MSRQRHLLLFTLVLALAVVLLGAYVRLSDAGLGCPDWPGCYGRVTPWHAGEQIAAAHAADPFGPVSHAKAWKEMAHRYLAGTLGLAILAIAWLAWRRPSAGGRAAPSALLALVAFQSLLGMWTVTRQLQPAVVTAHLLGGMAILALLLWLLAPRRPLFTGAGAPLAPARAALVLVVLQIALGGWVSANYAALACADLPTCRGEWWPAADYATAFGFGHGLGGLSAEALTAIHLTHRLGAVVVLAAVLALAATLARVPGGRRAAGWLLAVVGAQCLLGIGNVLLSLPLPLAVAHNAGAAALLLTLVWINAGLTRRPA